MGRQIVIVAAAAALIFGGVVSAGAQASRGATTLTTATKNFTPIEKAACGPYWGRWCGPFHHRVCGPRGRCWCAHC